MSKVSVLLVFVGAVAVIYGLLLLWSAKQADQDLTQQGWLKSEEIVQSRYRNFNNMRFFLRPERQNISFSKSRTRAYAMILLGIGILVLAFT